MASEITNKTSQKFKGKQKRALPLDDSAYPSPEIFFFNFSMPIIAKCQPLHRPSILVADYNQKVTICICDTITVMITKLEYTCYNY